MKTVLTVKMISYWLKGQENCSWRWRTTTNRISLESKMVQKPPKFCYIKVRHNNMIWNDSRECILNYDSARTAMTNTMGCIFFQVLSVCAWEVMLLCVMKSWQHVRHCVFVLCCTMIPLWAVRSSSSQTLRVSTCSVVIKDRSSFHIYLKMRSTGYACWSRDGSLFSLDRLSG